MSYPPPRPPYPQSPPPSTYSLPAFSTSTPPPPPPKPQDHSPSRHATPQDGPPPPAPATHSSSYAQEPQSARYQELPPAQLPSEPQPPGLDEGWLPETVRDKSTADLRALLLNPTLLSALALSPSTTHSSLSSILPSIHHLLAINLSLANHLLAFSSQLTALRTRTSHQLLDLHRLERQWRQKQSALDEALERFSPKALHQRLVQSIGEQERVVRALEESFLEGEGKAGERETGEFLKRWREERKVLEVRRERRERWEEGRVGGWR